MAGSTRHGSISTEHLRKREQTFDLSQSLENEVIFDGNSNIISQLISEDAGLPPVTVTCVKCCTSGSLTASFNDDDIVDPTFRIDMKDMSAFVELDITANGDSSFSIPLLPSPANFLSSLIKGVDASLGFSIDLVFNVATGLDIHGGFSVDFPDDAFFEASLLDGTMTDLSFDGIMTQSLPLSINLNGTQTFQVALRLQAAVGFDVSDSIPLIDISGGASVGAYVNLVEFVAEVDSTTECQLQSAESANLNVGVFGGANVKVGDLSVGAVPTVSTTLFSADIGTQCLAKTGVPIPSKIPAATSTAECALTTSGHLPAASGAAVTKTAGQSGISGFVPTTTVPSGSTAVMTVTACASPVINCPADLAFAFEITQAICVQAATTAPGFCFAANATSLVPMISLTSPITASLDPPASETGCTTALPSLSNRTMSRQTTSGMVFATTRPTHPASPSGLGGVGSGGGKNATATGARQSTPMPTSPTVVTVSGGERPLEKTRGFCSMVLAAAATILIFFL